MAIGKFFVPTTAHTPADRVREALDKSEKILATLRGSGPKVLSLLHLMDRAAASLAELEALGVDVRAEQVRFESVKGQLRNRKTRFLREAKTALLEERALVQPERDRWWWFLDEEVALERKQNLRRWAIRLAVAAVLLLIGWFIYDRFIAPPPEVRRAYHHSMNGEAYAEEGKLEEALAEFQAAAALTPEDPSPWLWVAVLSSELGHKERAEEAFARARSLYGSEYEFLLSRTMILLRLKRLEAALSDVEKAIALDPSSGRGYYTRSLVLLDMGDRLGAIADLEQASRLAHEAGDTHLEAMARAQMAMVMQMITLPSPEGTPP
ncbi:MAG: tetratricopeptide repeat protein [Anaerolineae bacterium]|nr:tetratricopeptide repeat protein [Anaerolineae bacterium]